MIAFLREAARVIRIVERDLMGGAVRLPSQDVRADAIGAWCLRCGASVAMARRAGGCAQCAGRQQRREFTVRVGPHESGLRDAVLALKHHGDRSAGRNVARTLAQQCSASGILPIGSGRCAVTSVPMPFARWCERGVDHAGVIAREVARALGFRFVPLLVQDAGPTQASLASAARRRRVGRFRLRARHRCPAGLELLLVVDDVLTTGSTAEGVAGVLLRAGLARRVGAAVVTVADPDSPPWVPPRPMGWPSAAINAG